MVLALRAGTKTQTRRAVKRFALEWLTMQNGFNANFVALPENKLSPYGYVGDRLAVRETFYAWGRWETRFSAKKGRDEWHFVDMTLECGKSYLYAVNGLQPQPMGGKRHKGGVAPAWWKRPAIFMPRVASRIALEITSVRMERLQNISEADAKAEGATPIPDPCDHVRLACADIGCTGPQPYRAGFRALWQSINGPESWDANPWVWVVEWDALLNVELGINWAAERAAFEHWFGTTQTKNPVRAHAKSETGTYIDGLTRSAWRAWRHAVMRGATGKAAVVDA